MKIRITKKGLPKAEVGGECPEGYVKDAFGTCVPQLMAQPSQQNNFAWTNFSQPNPALSPATKVVNTDGTTTMTGNVGTPTTVYATGNVQGTPVTNPDPVMPIKRFNKNTWINKDQSKLGYAVNKGLGDAVDFLQNNKVAKGILGAANTASQVKDFLLPIADIFDKKRENNEIERRYREDLMALGPIDYTRNRGDYEMNTGMVDPYNTGAKSKGQFTNLQYLPMAQDGLSLGPISFSDDPVQRNVYQYASEVSIPISENRNVAASTYVARPAMMSSESAKDIKQFIGAKESGNNYRAIPKDKSGKLMSSAAGKYQFLWNTHKNNIARITGVTSKEEFLNNPQAQEAYMDYWDQTVLTPTANKIQQKYNINAPIHKIKYMIHFAGPAGAENYFATGKETEDSFGMTTTKLWNKMQYGGENSDSMKIRITKVGLDQMAYGGQSNYGLDLGNRNVYTEGPESPYSNPGKVLGPVPEEYATIEAEKDETILTDVDGDGVKEHMVIGGKKHENGGTLLNAEPGDFVFSDHKPKMAIKNETILGLFGKKYKKGGYTPAEIAKQYDTNKFKAILEDKNADPISKNTAEIMINNYNNKLGLLSLVQEAKKGFPQGIPAVAESVLPTAAFGGYLEQYQTKGQVTPEKIKKSELPQYIAKGYKPVQGTPRLYELLDKIKVKDATPGTPGSVSTTFKKRVPVITQAWLNASPEQRKKMSAAAQKKWELDPGNIIPGSTVVPGTPGTPEQWEDVRRLITFDEEPQKTTPPSNPPDVPPFNPENPNTPYGWTNPDIRNLATALLNRTYIKKYPSVRRDFNPVTSNFRNMDWRGRAAELQGAFRNQADTLGTYQSPTSLAANMSFMSGQQAENLVNRAIDPIEQQNVSIYNQVAAQNNALVNQASAMAAQNQFLRSQDRAVLNQTYNQEMIDSNNAITQAMNTGETNAAGIYNTNITESPYYYIDPRSQRMVFNSEQARAAFEAARRSAGPNDNDMVSQYLNIRSRLSGIPENEKDDVARELMGLNRSGRTSATNYPFNPKMNKTTVQQPFIPNYGYYPQYLPQQPGQ